MDPLILILDDEEAQRTILSSELIKNGYRTHAMLSKAQGYDWAIEHRPDLVLSDIRSPGMHGFQFLKWLKANERTRNIGFVFVTAFADLRNAIEAKKLGADDFISKPYDIDDLLPSITRVLEDRRSVSQTPSGFSTEGMIDQNRNAFLPWCDIRELATKAVKCWKGPFAAVGADTEWQEQFVLEHGSALVGSRFFRPLEPGPVSGIDLLSCKGAMQELGLDHQVLWSLVASGEESLRLGRLLGIAVMPAETTNRLLEHAFKNQREKTLRLLHSAVTEAANLKASEGFISFFEQVNEELRELNEISVVIPEASDAKAPIEVLIQVAPIIRLIVKERNYRWIDSRKMSELAGSLWASGEITRTSVGSRVEDQCLYELFSRLSLVESSGDRLHLRRKDKVS